MSETLAILLATTTLIFADELTEAERVLAPKPSFDQEAEIRRVEAISRAETEAAAPKVQVHYSISDERRAKWEADAVNHRINLIERQVYELQRIEKARAWEEACKTTPVNFR
ncbi:MAG: hypothetical protein WBV90_07430 [Terrimicrobiaceae bacterium]